MLFSPAFSKDARGGRDTSYCLVDPGELADWILADSVPHGWGCRFTSSFGIPR